MAKDYDESPPLTVYQVALQYVKPKQNPFTCCYDITTEGSRKDNITYTAIATHEIGESLNSNTKNTNEVNDVTWTLEKSGQDDVLVIIHYQSLINNSVRTCRMKLSTNPNDDNSSTNALFEAKKFASLVNSKRVKFDHASGNFSASKSEKFLSKPEDKASIFSVESLNFLSISDQVSGNTPCSLFIFIILLTGTIILAYTNALVSILVFSFAIIPFTCCCIKTTSNSNKTTAIVLVVLIAVYITIFALYHEEEDDFDDYYPTEQPVTNDDYYNHN
jgi:hypothetical protein